MKTKEEIARRLSILDEIYKIAKPALDNFYNYGLRESEVITRQKRLDILDNICQALKPIEKIIKEKKRSGKRR
ncbi:MAG: hypothetical protein GH148_02495 [Clostridia bacterium]|nr:hypothetical protein [Clostridia bacterium]